MDGDNIGSTAVVLKPGSLGVAIALEGILKMDGHGGDIGSTDAVPEPESSGRQQCWSFFLRWMEAMVEALLWC